MYTHQIFFIIESPNPCRAQLLFLMVLFQGKLLYYIAFSIYSSFKIDFIIVSHAKTILITIIHTIRINLLSHFGYAILVIIDILQQ